MHQGAGGHTLKQKEINLMRRHQQRQVIELLQTLKEAQSSGMYADCQECALVVGEFIEGVAGEGTQTVVLLEEYYELLFEASENAIGEKLLHAHLAKVERSVKSELKPDRIEIAFLSYKASMSDSIESIYLAAKADPKCDAFWIPVPYYDRNADGSLGRMHYEGTDHYARIIECTDWREYNIEVRRPDVIFTFNPYDAGNFVTSVHPDYYCERLCGLTDFLIYIPYFVLLDDVPEHFCTTAGCVYAHKVVLQSEKVRDTYVRVFSETYGNRYGRPKDKFIALGSPKYDKVISSNRENCKLPDEWRSLIDGKKVVLLNTTIGSMLTGDEIYLKKLRHVLDVFSKRDDVVLWWRPHPLSEATYSSMRRLLLNEYEQIVADYRRAGWGIYDDTVELHSAMAWTDAYYGDGSSLVALYKATGKPVLMKNSGDDIELADKQALIFVDLIHVNGSLWFTAMNYNSLFRLDAETLETEHMGFFPNEVFHQWRQYFSIVEAGNSIYFAPLAADGLVEYSLASGKYRHIELPEPAVVSSVVEYMSYTKFLQAFHYEHYIILAPCTYPGILRFNLETGEFDVFKSWIKELEPHIIEPSLGYFSRGLILEEKLILACASANAVFEFDLVSSEHKIYPINNSNMGYFGICHDGTDFWLLPVNAGAVIRWNKSAGLVCEYRELIEDTEFDGYWPYINICCTDKYVWILPYVGNSAVKIDLEIGTVSVASEFQSELDEKPSSNQFKNWCYSMQCIINENIYAFSARNNRLLAYNTQNGQMIKKSIELSADDAVKLVAEQFRRLSEDSCQKTDSYDSVMHEHQTLLKDYLDYLVRSPGGNSQKAKTQPTSNAGELIYEHIKQAVTAQWT